jgi:hypothetical protein
MIKRSKRYFFEQPPLTSEQYKYDQRYNRFWIAGGFGALGYHNIKDIASYRALFQRLEKQNDAVIKFLSLEGRQVSIKNLDKFSDQLNKCINQYICSDSINIKIIQKLFNKESEVFTINSSSDFVLIQNEMYSPVWKGQICRNENNCIELKSIPVLESLRGWNLPKGEYTLVTFAETPHDKLRWLLFYAGVLISISVTILNLYLRNSGIKNYS